MRHGRIAIGGPQFRRPARSRIDDRKPGGESQLADDPLGLGAVRLMLRHLKSNCRRLNSKRPQQFQVAIDHVDCLRVNELIVEPSAQFAAAGIAEPDSPFGGGEPCQDSRFRQTLNVDRRIELQIAQSAVQSPNAAGRLEPTPRQFDQFVQCLVSPQQRRRPRFDGPGEKCSGKAFAQGAGDRHRLNGVADRAEADNQDAG